MPVCLRRSPDGHTTALYVNGQEGTEYGTIAELRRQMEKWAYAKQKQAESE